MENDFALSCAANRGVLVKLRTCHPTLVCLSPMLSGRHLRILFALLATVLFLAAGAFAVFLGESLLNIWRELERLGQPALIIFLLAILVVCLLFGWVVWRLLMPPKSVKPDGEYAAQVDEAAVQKRLTEARDAGIDTTVVDRELAELRKRRQAGEIHIAFFGEISSGKSALVRALLPSADTPSAVTGGTTRNLASWRWQSRAGDALVLVDMPGLNEAQGSLDPLATEEALRAHIVVLVLDGDLTRSQKEALGRLRELHKPTVIALNKSDRFAQDELDLLRSNLAKRIDDPEVPVVVVRGGGLEPVTRVLPDGTSQRTERERPPDVDELAKALQRIIDSRAEILHELRDSSMFVLAARKLDEAASEYRADKARELVRSYSRKAVVGALAAVTPGADLVIQGVLASQMIKELSQLYDVPVRRVDTDLLLELVGRYVGKTTTLVLAVAGNAFKSFPGVGTITGGILHAIAYGMIFDTLGRAVAESLATRGELRPVQAAEQFKETLGENLESSARQFARMALEEVRKPRD